MSLIVARGLVHDVLNRVEPRPIVGSGSDPGDWLESKRLLREVDSHSHGLRPAAEGCPNDKVGLASDGRTIGSMIETGGARIPFGTIPLP